MDTKLTCDLPIKETIDEDDFLLCSGHGMQKNGLPTNQDFLIRAKDFANKIRSKNQFDSVINLLKRSKNIDVKYNSDSITAYYSDSAMIEQYKNLMDDISDLATIVDEVVASKTANWKGVVQDTFNSDQVRDNGDNLYIDESPLSPDEFLNIVNVAYQESNVRIFKNNNELVFETDLSSDKEIMALKAEIAELKQNLKFEPSIREGKLMLLFNQTLRYLNASHLDITPLCDPYVTDSSAGTNVNTLLSFTNHSYVNPDFYQEKKNDLILQLKFQNNFEKTEFQYMTNTELGYFEVVKNSLWYLSHRDLSFASLKNDKSHPLSLYKEGEDFKTTVMIAINKKTEINGFENVCNIFTIFSQTCQEKIELFISKTSCYLLINSDEKVELSWNIFNFDKNTILTFSIDIQSISIYARQDSSTLIATKSISKNFINALKSNDFNIVCTSSEKKWYCSGLTIFGDSININQINNYIDSLYFFDGFLR